MARVLIAGCGYVGNALGELLVEDGAVVWGLRRHPASLPPRLRAIEADLSAQRTLEALPRDLDFVFYTAAPSVGAEEIHYRHAYIDGLRNLLTSLEERKQSPKRIFFTSSTSVFGQNDGSVVDEDSEAKPLRFNGKILLEAEELLGAAPFPSTVVRFGGIYGSRRTRLIESVRAGRARYRDDPPLYTNRIHVDDCASVLRHLLQLPDPDALYLAVDDEPATERMVMEWMAGVIGSPIPRPATGEEQGTGRVGGNKRCSNLRLRASGFSFRYPTFREGYGSLIEGLV